MRKVQHKITSQNRNMFCESREQKGWKKERDQSFFFGCSKRKHCPYFPTKIENLECIFEFDHFSLTLSLQIYFVELDIGLRSPTPRSTSCYAL